MAKRVSRTGPPSPLHSLMEFRGLLELAALPYAIPLLMQVPKGDGHPVLLLPGFMADEKTLFALKYYLDYLGYSVETWGFGRNVGFQLKHAKALEQKVRYMHHKHGKKLSLVGWSLGGVFAMYATHRAPECVRSVITLGSPVSTDMGSETSPLVKALYRAIAHPMGPSAHSAHPRAKLMQGLPPVPASCLYSLSDGVVPPQDATIDGDVLMHENIRVPGSHVGLGFNALVLWFVADRLAQTEGKWEPFQPSGLLGRIYEFTTSAAVPA